MSDDLNKNGQWDSSDYDFGAWVDSDISQACLNMGASRPKQFKDGTSEDVISYIRDSSYFAIMSHGSSDSIRCVKLSGESPYYTYNTDYLLNTQIQNLYDGYFSTTRCAVLCCCLCGYGREKNSSNLVNLIHQKGAWTVIGFSESIAHISGKYNMDMGSPKWCRTLAISLSNGKTVKQAVREAETAAQRSSDGYKFGLDRVYIAGDENQILTQ